MNTLPSGPLYDIIFQTPIEDIPRLCRSEKRFAEACRDPRIANYIRKTIQERVDRFMAFMSTGGPIEHQLASYLLQISPPPTARPLVEETRIDNGELLAAYHQGLNEATNRVIEDIYNKNNIPNLPRKDVNGKYNNIWGSLLSQAYSIAPGLSATQIAGQFQGILKQIDQVNSVVQQDYIRQFLFRHYRLIPLLESVASKMRDTYR